MCAAFQEDPVLKLLTAVGIIDPALQTMVLVPEDIALEQGFGWEDCCWDPSGALLVASVSMQDAFTQQYWESRSSLCILDPGTLRPIFRADQDPAKVSWGMFASSRLPGTMVAYMPELCSRVTFWRDQDEWHVEVRSLKDIEYPHTGCLTPDGSTLLLTQANAQDSIRLCQFAFDSSQTIAIADLPPHDPFRALAVPFKPQPSRSWHGTLVAGHYKNSWNPLLRSWAGLYAFTYTHALQGRAQSVKLVDAKAHKVLGSWSGSDLALLTGRRVSRKDGVPEDL